MKYLSLMLLLLVVGCDNTEYKIRHYTLQVRYENGILDTLECDATIPWLNTEDGHGEIRNGLGGSVASTVASFKILSEIPVPNGR